MTTPEWHTAEFPELRRGPPWVTAEMMAAQPGLAPAILGQPHAELADAIAETVRGGEVVTVCGCGTSEHAAHGVAALIAAAVGAAARARVRVEPSLTAALAPAPGLCLAVSHDGGTRATQLALEAAAGAGARTAVITARADGDVARAADLVLATPVRDRSWCHTVGYTSAVLAGAALAARLGAEGIDAEGAGELMAGALDATGADAVAERLADRRVVLCAGAGTDRTTARELALKLAEGARLATIPLELETVLHGQLAGHEPSDALILVAIDDDPGQERIARRAEHVARAAAAIGIPVAALLSPAQAGRLDDALTPAGRLVAPARAIHPTLGALLGGVMLAQTLTLAVAHARGTNPDLIRREERPYRDAAAVAESDGGW